MNLTPWEWSLGWTVVGILVAWAWRNRRTKAVVTQRLETFVVPDLTPTSARARRERRSWQNRWRQGPRAAALRLRASEYLMFRVGSFVVPFGVGYLMRGLLGGVLLGGIGIIGVTVYFRVKQRRWLTKAEESLPEFLRGVASALRAGSSLSQAMSLVAQETPDPLGGEILRVMRREALGFNLSDTLEEITRRIPSRDLALATMAITIQREVGGSLADLLDNIVRTIVDRQRLKREIRIVTSQGRFSGGVLIALPFFLGVIIWFTDPGYIGPLFQSHLGWGLLGGAALSLVLGAVVINRLVQAPEM